MRGVVASRPAADAAKVGRLYVATDEGKVYRDNGTGWDEVANDGYLAGGTDVAVADGGTGSSTASGARTNLGLVIGTDVQAHDADLDTIAGLTATTDNFIQAKSSAWASRTVAQVQADLQGTGLGSTEVGFRII